MSRIMDYDEVLDIICAKIRETGYTREEIAYRMNGHASSVTNWINKKYRMRLFTMGNVCDALGISIIVDGVKVNVLEIADLVTDILNRRGISRYRLGKNIHTDYNILDKWLRCGYGLDFNTFIKVIKELDVDFYLEI